MSKVITSPVDRWPGTVYLPDPMTMPQVLAFEKALTQNNEYFEDVDGQRVLRSNMLWGTPDSEWVKIAILPIVEEWHLSNFPDPVTEENFPFTPRVASRELVNWLVNEIFMVYAGEVDIPNE